MLGKREEEFQQHEVSDMPLTPDAESWMLKKNTLDCVKSMHYSKFISTKRLPNTTVFNNNNSEIYYILYHAYIIYYILVTGI